MCWYVPGTGVRYDLVFTDGRSRGVFSLIPAVVPPPGGEEGEAFDMEALSYWRRGGF